MDRHSVTIAFLFSTSLLYNIIHPSTTIVGISMGFLIDALIFSISVPIAIYSFRRVNKLQSPAPILYALLVIWGIMILNAIRLVVYDGGSPVIVFRVVAYALSGSMMMFAVPYIIDRSVVLTVTARMAALLSIVGIPTVVWDFIYARGTKGFTRFSFIQWTPVDSIRIPALSSVFYNVNQLSYILFIGLLAGLWEYYRRRSVLSIVQLAVIALGLYLNHSRGAMVAALVGIFVILFSRLFSDLKNLSPVLASLAICSGVATLLLTFLHEDLGIYLTSRQDLWKAGMDALFKHPLLGYGVQDTGEVIRPFLSDPDLSGKHPHNAYIRMFLTGGIFTGLSYIFLMWYSNIQSVLNSNSLEDICIVSIGTAICINQLFELYTVFGFRIQALLSALIVGYLIKNCQPSNQEYISWNS